MEFNWYPASTTFGAPTPVYQFLCPPERTNEALVYQSLKFEVSMLTDEPPRLSLLNLPPEICNRVVFELPPSAQICLGLTCKELYAKYFISKRDLGGALNVTHNVLQLLEKDMCGYYLCSDCIKLHRWELRKDKTVYFPDPCERGAGTVTWQLPSAHNYRYILDWRHAKLGYLHHMYGEGHGLPMQFFERSTRTDLANGGYCPKERRGVLIHECWKAKFADGKMLLKTTYTLTTTSRANNCISKITEFLANARRDAPKWREMTLVCSWLPLMEAIEEAGFNLALDSAEEGPVGYTCDCLERYRLGTNMEQMPECNTYYEMNKVRDDDTGGWKIVLTAFRNLVSRQGGERDAVVTFPDWDDLCFVEGKELWESN